MSLRTGTPRRWRPVIRWSLAARLLRPGESGDAGFVSFYVVVITMGLLAMAGLVIDGGNALAARQQAADVSQQAARAGADALSASSLRGADPAQLSATPAGAAAAADRVLAAGGVTGAVRVDGDVVRVSVSVHTRTSILSAVGLNQVSGHATSTATAIRGTTTGGS